MAESIDNKGKDSSYQRLYTDAQYALADPVIPQIVKKALGSLLDIHPKYLSEAQKNASLNQQHQKPDYTQEKNLVNEMGVLTAQVNEYVQSRKGRNWNFDLISAAQGFEKAVSSAQSRLGRGH